MSRPPHNIAGIVKNVEDYVNYLKENGVTEVAASLQRRADKTDQIVGAPLVGARSDETERASERRLNRDLRDAGTELKAIADEIAACVKCALRENRAQTVPGQGNPRPEILFIGEGPGEEEDRRGLAFVGAAGQLLTRLITKMGFAREDVFIANIVKCRPPHNRKPLPEEARACLPYLEQQIAILNPKIIVLLGACAFETLLPPELPETTISKARGKWLEYKGIPVMPTFHPSYLLRNQSAMWDVWADMEKVLTFLGRKTYGLQR